MSYRSLSGPPSLQPKKIRKGLEHVRWRVFPDFWGALGREIFFGFFFFGGFYRGQKKTTQTFFVQSFSTTLRVMDVRAENRGRPHQKVRFPAAPVVGRNFLTPGHPGVSVRNVRGKSGPKSLCLCCFSFQDNEINTNDLVLKNVFKEAQDGGELRSGGGKGST